MEVDQRLRPDALDEIRGHALLEVVSSDEHRGVRTVLGEVHHRLPCRVPGADDHHLLTGALHGFAAARAVVDAVADQLVDPVQLEAAPIHPGCREHDSGGDLGTVVEDQGGLLVDLALEPASLDAGQKVELRAELLRLAPGQPGELRPADPVGEAEVVLDHRGVRSLAPGDVAIEDDGREAIRRRVHGRREPSRTCPDHGDVVAVAARRRDPAPGPRDRLDGGRCMRLVTLDDHGQRGFGEAAPGQHAVRLPRTGLQPLIRLGNPRQEIPQAVVLGVHAPADYLNRRACRAHRPSLRLR